MKEYAASNYLFSKRKLCVWMWMLCKTATRINVYHCRRCVCLCLCHNHRSLCDAPTECHHYVNFPNFHGECHSYQFNRLLARNYLLSSVLSFPSPVQASSRKKVSAFCLSAQTVVHFVGPNEIFRLPAKIFACFSVIRTTQTTVTHSSLDLMTDTSAICIFSHRSCLPGKTTATTTTSAQQQ